jgi:triosephosphate isomerase
MNKATRRAVIAGNWKMNNTAADATALINAIKAEIAGKDTSYCEIIAGVPFTDIAAAIEAAKGSNIKISAQNVHWAEKGAFTGEISADMLKEAGVEYVIIGHSERRQYFGETDDTVNKRVKAALANGLKVILCVGEVLEQRELGVTEEVVAMQTKIDLFGIPAEDMKNVIIAYEPVWAIGTGKTATADQAEEVCAIIRGVLAKLYGDAVAEATTIQYGGSMNAKNAAELLSKKNVDGGLIGGASLKAPDFAAIIEAAAQ